MAVFPSKADRIHGPKAPMDVQVLS